MALSPASQAVAGEAAKVTRITAEEDYFEAKLLYQALPMDSEPQLRLRGELLEYLLGPLATLDAKRLRHNPGILGSEGDFGRLQDSFRDALSLFSPEDLYTRGMPSLTARERQLLLKSAKLLVAAYSPRGSELPVATALYVLISLEPTQPDWSSRLRQLMSWLDAAGKLASEREGPHRIATPTDVLEGVAVVWPTPAVLSRLTQVVFAREDKLAGLLHRPLGSDTGARGLISELLLDTEALSNMSLATAALYLRCGQVAQAYKVALHFADKPGDDPDFRRLLAATLATPAKDADYLALARRFLPRSELLRGTSTDTIDPEAAMGTLRLALRFYPQQPDTLILASRVARMLSSPVQSQRYLEEAIAALTARKASPDAIAALEAERMDLAFLRLRMHADPDHIAQAEAEAVRLRARLAQVRARFGASHFKIGDADIDYVLASGLIDAGQIEKAIPLLLRARGDGDVGVEVTRQLASLAIKRGQPREAITILQQALDQRARKAPAEDTIPYVEGQAKLSYLLGNAFEITADLRDARKAWGSAVHGWERLMLEQMRRKDPSASAEATFQVGRLYYLLGRHEEGLRKFEAAVGQDEERDQTYLDTISFLVQRGESETALDIYRRALAQSDRAVSEYVKVYTSMWILDLTRRSTGEPDPGAMAYLHTVADRKILLRPPRAAAWYTQLARYATGELSYAALLAKADTTGKRAEAYFYEAMRRLADGHSEEAHALWSKVIGTKMMSFFEFEMAERYLRTGAPARPQPVDQNETV